MKKNKYGVIYMVRNTINNKVYFGQTIEKRGFDGRYKGNFFKYTHNEHLKKSIEKHGTESFEIIKKFDVAYSEDELNELEEMYIKMYNATDKRCGYNKSFGGNNKRHTEEIKKKISESNIGKHNLKGEFHPLFGITGENHPNYGRRNTEETKKKMSDSAYKRFENSNGTMMGRKHTKEAIEKMRKWQQENNPKRGTKQPNEVKSRISNSLKKEYLIVDTNTKEYLVFKGQKELSDYIGMSKTYVQRRLVDKKLHNNKYLLIKRKDYEKTASKPFIMCLRYSLLL